MGLKATPVRLLLHAGIVLHMSKRLGAIFFCMKSFSVDIEVQSPAGQQMYFESADTRVVPSEARSACEGFYSREKKKKSTYGTNAALSKCNFLLFTHNII